MITFEEKMRESNDVFKEEQKMLDITRRLVEQNEYADPTRYIRNY